MTEVAWVHCPKPTEGTFSAMRVDVQGGSTVMNENEAGTLHHVAANFRCCNYTAQEEVCGEPLAVFLPEFDATAGLFIGALLVSRLSRRKASRASR
jgi:hypothetical protein